MKASFIEHQRKYAFALTYICICTYIYAKDIIAIAEIML